MELKSGKQIDVFAERIEVLCYTENVFNRVSNECRIYPFEVK